MQGSEASAGCPCLADGQTRRAPHAPPLHPAPHRGMAAPSKDPAACRGSTWESGQRERSARLAAVNSVSRRAGALLPRHEAPEGVRPNHRAACAPEVVQAGTRAGAVAMVKAAPSQKTPLPTAAAQGLPTAAQHSIGSRWRFCAFSRTLPGPGLPRHTPPRRRHGRFRLEARATKSTPVLTDRYPTTALNSGPHGTATGRLRSRKCVRPPWDPALQPRTQGPCVVPLRHPADAPAALLRKPQAEAGGWALLCGLDSDGSPSSADEGYQGLLPLLRAISAGPRAQAT